MSYKRVSIKEDSDNKLKLLKKEFQLKTKSQISFVEILSRIIDKANLKSILN